MILASIPSPPQGVWHLGPIPLRAYALCIIVGIVVACWWGERRWVARGGRPGQVLDVAVWAVPFGLIGGRLYHVLTDFSTYFGAGGRGFGAVFRIWDGGLGIWGAVALGAVGAWIGCHRAGIKLPAFGDAIAPPIIVAQAIGRLGNWFNQELYGAPTTVPWGLKIYERTNDLGQRGPDVLNGSSDGVVLATVHPTFLYEVIWNLLVAAALVLLDRRFRIGHGRLFALYVAGYCLGRFFIELMRDDHATHILGVRINVFTAVIVFLCAVAYFILAPKGREASVYTSAPPPEWDEDDDYYGTHLDDDTATDTDTDDRDRDGEPFDDTDTAEVDEDDFAEALDRDYDAGEAEVHENDLSESGGAGGVAGASATSGTSKPWKASDTSDQPAEPTQPHLQADPEPEQTSVVHRSTAYRPSAAPADPSAATDVQDSVTPGSPGERVEGKPED